MHSPHQVRKLLSIPGPRACDVSQTRICDAIVFSQIVQSYFFTTSPRNIIPSETTTWLRRSQPRGYGHVPIMRKIFPETRAWSPPRFALFARFVHPGPTRATPKQLTINNQYTALQPSTILVHDAVIIRKGTNSVSGNKGDSIYRRGSTRCHRRLLHNLHFAFP